MFEKEILLKAKNIIKYSTAKVIAVVGVACFVFLSISLISYNIKDIPEITYPYNIEPVNFFGETGARTSFSMINFLGAGVLVFLFSLLNISMQIFMLKKPGEIALKTICASLFIISFSGLLAQWDFSFAQTSPTGGGIIGFTIFNLVNNIMNLQATRMLLVLGMLSGLFISTDLLYISKLSSIFSNWKSHLAEKAEKAKKSEKKEKPEKKSKTEKIKFEINRPETNLESEPKPKKSMKLKQFIKSSLHVISPVRLFGKLKKKNPKPNSTIDLTIPEEFKITEDDLKSPDSSDSGFHEIETYLDLEDQKLAENKEVTSDTMSIEPVQDKPCALPEISLLKQNLTSNANEQNKEIQENAALLYEAMKNYGIKARIKSVSMGPTVSMYEVELAPGTKIKRLSAISSELAMVLRAPSVRIVAPIPGKSSVGIEVPNKAKNMVTIRDMLESPEFKHSTNILPVALGLTSVGEPIYSDLAKMPHLLIAGTTGSGKSVAANIIITSLIYKFNSQDVKFVLIDPKMVEFSAFKNIPHLMYPVITEVNKAPHILSVLVEEMEERYRILEKTLCKNIEEYNELTDEERAERIAMSEEVVDGLPAKLPYIVTVIDELADLMMVAGKEIESSIVRLAQKSRAIGIHLIIATQRPSVDVITGLIKANIPCRMAFRVLSQIDSRTILDRPGAEKLLGSGDMLYLPPGSSDVLRVQNAFISNNEILKIAQFLKKNGSPNYKTLKIKPRGTEFHKDEEFIAAAEFVTKYEQITAKNLTEILGIGNKKASEILGKLEEFGVVGPANGRKPRDVIMCTRDFFIRLNEKAA